MTIIALALALLNVQPGPQVSLVVPADRSKDQAEVVATVNALLAAISARDETAALRHLRGSGTATVLMEKPNAAVTLRSVPLSTYAQATPGPERYLERIIDPAILVDGNMAAVWGRYQFSIDGKLRHCGFQHHDLVRENGRWLIQNVTWSVRSTDCES